MDLPKGKKIYFASDFHLGIPDHVTSIEREKRICRWLDHISADAARLYLVGDLFDTWFEYKNVVPKGYTRFLGKLAELTDKGMPIEAFTGNHDLWMLDYFEKELNIPVHHNPILREINGKKFLIGHGDGLGPGDHGYKVLKKYYVARFRNGYTVACTRIAVWVWPGGLAVWVLNTRMLLKKNSWVPKKKC